MHYYQKTIKNIIKASGIALHTGKDTQVVLKPLPANSGVWFKRSDTHNSMPIEAISANVTDTSLATTIGEGHSSVKTIEHLLAAFAGLGIDNILVEVSGAEIPVFDGSAKTWVNLLKQANIIELPVPRIYYVLNKEFKFVDGDKYIEIKPANELVVDLSIDFGSEISACRSIFTLNGLNFEQDISSARTFCKLQDVEYMRKNGLALGGSLENAVVVNEGQVLNPEGLRYPDEFSRHKILDLLGDLALSRFPILGHISGYKTGHNLNYKFLSAMLKEESLLKAVTFAKNKGAKSNRFFIPKRNAILTKSALAF